MSKKIIKNSILIFFITIFCFIIVEGISRFIYNVKITKIKNYSDSGCNLDKKKFIPNCEIKIKRWENKEQILYKINNNGYRESFYLTILLIKLILFFLVIALPMAI